MKEKIIEREKAVAIKTALSAEGKKVGFTSGVFDIVHAGHVEYLEYAKSLVDILFVGINSDASVKQNKGDARPINSERLRAEVIAGLQAVDYVFVFGERNNNINTEMLAPDVYIKAGDYSPERLSSKDIVERHGGRIELVPFKKGLSTTSVIEKIQLAAVSEDGEKISYSNRPAVFIDRDGTINEHVEYLSEPSKFREIPGAYKGIKRLQDLGFRIVVVTNQAGIGLGYFSREDLYAVNREMMKQASQQGCSFDKIYFCPHSKADNCECRKPGTYFIERAERDLSIDVRKSFVIGDMTSDIKFGLDAGAQTVLVKTGRGGEDGMFSVVPHHTAKDLLEAAEVIAGLVE
jgi:rfaE bifunctional protein nucleotidyltransferase chain/domain